MTNTIRPGTVNSARLESNQPSRVVQVESMDHRTSTRRFSTNNSPDKQDYSLDLLSRQESGFSPNQPSKFRSGFYSQNAMQKPLPAVILKPVAKRLTHKGGTALPKTVNLYGGSDLVSLNLSRRGSSKMMNNWDQQVLDSGGSTTEKDPGTAMIGPNLKKAFKLPLKIVTTDRSLIPESNRTSHQTPYIDIHEEIVPLFSGRNSLAAPHSSSRSYKWKNSLGNYTAQSGQQSGSSGVQPFKMGPNTLKQLARVGAEIGMTLKDNSEHHPHPSEESARESSKKRYQPKVEKNLPLRLDTGMDLVKELGQVKVFNQYVSERERQARLMFNLSHKKPIPEATKVAHLAKPAAMLNHSHISEVAADEEFGQSRSEMTPVATPKPIQGRSAALDLKNLILHGSVKIDLKKKRTSSWTKDTLESVEPSHPDVRASLNFQNSFMKSSNTSKITRNANSEMNISKDP